jgi:acyl dehydratase
MTESEPSFRTRARELVGTEFHVGEWVTITQEQIDAFAATTGDNNWIHTDPVRASQESPYGTTVAHGYLTIALLPSQMGGYFRKLGATRSINYGLNRVRFIAPVRAGAKIRAHFTMKSAEEIGDGLRVTNDVRVEADDEEKPVCLAETIALHF